MVVQNSLNGMDKRLDSVPTKSKVSAKDTYIDNELDHARLVTYTSQRRLICEGKGEGPKMARDQFFGEYSSLLESTVVFSR
jgi:hypothetical protein